MDLHERLKALGVTLGARHLRARARPSSGPDPRLLGAEEVATPLGPAWVIRQTYPQGHPHGAARLAPPAAPPALLARWAGYPDLTQVPPTGWYFLDTETSGLLGGAGTYVILVGVGFFRAGTFQVEQIFLRHPGEEAALLTYLETLLADAQALVTYNGKTFDLPLLRTRFRLNGWARPPFHHLKHVDLLHLVRRLWREILPNATLITTEARLLGTPRREDDIPGWMIPEMYAAYLRSGDPRPLQAVVYHNAMDVVSLAALLGRAAETLRAPHEAPLHGAEHLARARLMEEQGDEEGALAAYRAALAAPDLSDESRRRARARLAALHKRRGEWAEAVALWQQAAAAEEWYAYEELAKWHEHQRRDAAAALRWTEAALTRLARSEDLAARLRWEAPLRHRQARLRRKLARG